MRQQCNYHKCHRCIYRGQAADWEPDVTVPTGPMLAVGERSLPTKQVEVPRPPRKSKSSDPAPSRRRDAQPTSV